jgi:hypothetical protein
MEVQYEFSWAVSQDSFNIHLYLRYDSSSFAPECIPGEGRFQLDEIHWQYVTQ